jgi:hypothetical protein
LVFEAFQQFRIDTRIRKRKRKRRRKTPFVKLKDQMTKVVNIYPTGRRKIYFFH